MKKSIIIGLLLTLCSCQSQDKKKEVFTSKAFKTEAIKSTDLIKEKQLIFSSMVQLQS
jgi:PBP1b-binding outer membrane lipoprotein LpoB